MTFENYRNTDPHLLVGLVNTAMRNHGEDIDAFCRTHEINREVLEARLAEGGYKYFDQQRRFR